MGLFAFFRLKTDRQHPTSTVLCPAWCHYCAGWLIEPGAVSMPKRFFSFEELCVTWQQSWATHRFFLKRAPQPKRWLRNQSISEKKRKINVFYPKRSHEDPCWCFSMDCFPVWQLGQDRPNLTSSFLLSLGWSSVLAQKPILWTRNRCFSKLMSR